MWFPDVLALPLAALYILDESIPSSVPASKQLLYSFTLIPFKLYWITCLVKSKSLRVLTDLFTIYLSYIGLFLIILSLNDFLPASERVINIVVGDILYPLLVESYVFIYCCSISRNLSRDVVLEE